MVLYHFEAGTPTGFPVPTALSFASALCSGISRTASWGSLGGPEGVALKWESRINRISWKCLATVGFSPGFGGFMEIIILFIPFLSGCSRNCIPSSPLASSKRAWTRTPALGSSSRTCYSKHLKRPELGVHPVFRHTHSLSTCSSSLPF